MKSLFIFFLLPFYLSACAHAPAHRFTAPPTAPAQHSVDQARDAATSAQAHNAQASSLADRIDAKDRIIEEWRHQHP